MDTIELTSPAFETDGHIPTKYTCDGANVSPPLRWKGVPANAEVLVLVVEDPDAPGGTFTHWVAGDFSAELNGIEEGEVPGSAVQLENGFGENRYDGPCPPEGHGAHNYFFVLYAAHSPLNLDQDTPVGEVTDLLDEYAIARGELIGTYERA